MVPAGVGDVVALAEGGAARAFGIHHSVPSLGWALSGSDNQRPTFAFAGDGTVLPFENDPSLLDATVAVVDCSFVDSGTRVAARLGGHGHIQDWINLAPQLPCDVLVLAHLPPEATAEGLLASLRELGPDSPIVVPWMARQ